MPHGIWVTILCPMTETGFAVFVIIAFLLPVPLIAWLDRPPRRSEPEI